MRRSHRFILIASLAAAAGAAFWAWEKRVELFLVPRAWSEVVKRWEALREIETAPGSAGAELASLRESLDQAMRDLVALQRPDFPLGRSFSLTRVRADGKDVAYFVQFLTTKNESLMFAAVFAVDSRGRVLDREPMGVVPNRSRSRMDRSIRSGRSPFLSSELPVRMVAPGTRVLALGPADGDVRRFSIGSSGVIPLGSWTEDDFPIWDGEFLATCISQQSEQADDAIAAWFRSGRTGDLHRALSQIECFRSPDRIVTLGSFAPQVERLLDHPDPILRARVAALLPHSLSVSDDRLANLQSDPEPIVRAYAGRALALRTAVWRASSAVESFTRDPSRRVRVSTLREFAQSKNHETACRAVARLLEEEHVPEVCSTLASYSSEAVEQAIGWIERQWARQTTSSIAAELVTQIELVLMPLATTPPEILLPRAERLAALFHALSQRFRMSSLIAFLEGIAAIEHPRTDELVLAAIDRLDPTTRFSINLVRRLRGREVPLSDDRLTRFLERRLEATLGSDPFASLPEIYLLIASSRERGLQLLEKQFSRIAEATRSAFATERRYVSSPARDELYRPPLEALPKILKLLSEEPPSRWLFQAFVETTPVEDAREHANDVVLLYRRLKEARHYRSSPSSVLVRLEHPLADEVLAEEIRDIRDDSTSPAAMIVSSLIAYRASARHPALVEAIRWVASWDEKVTTEIPWLEELSWSVVTTGSRPVPSDDPRPGTGSPIEWALAAAILLDRWSEESSEPDARSAVRELLLRSPEIHETRLWKIYSFDTSLRAVPRE